MEYSCFTSYGQLEYASGVPDAEKIYESMRASYVDPKTGTPTIDLTVGTYHEAKIYARAMAIADGQASIRRAGNQENALKATEAIPNLEAILRLPPKLDATLESRRAAVAARLERSRGNRREAIYDALTGILGDALIAIRPIASDEATSWPADPSLGPGVFGRPEALAKVVRLVDAVTLPGAPQTVTYENWDTTRPDLVLVKGDELSVQGENIGQAEKVTISSVSGTGVTRSFTATFAKAHDEGASATTGPAPIWLSNAGHLFIVVTHEAAIDAALVGLVNERLTRIAKGGITWSIVEPTTPGAPTIGPFTFDSSPLGAVTIGTIDIEHLELARFAPPIPASVPAAGGTLCELVGRNLLDTSDVKVAGVSVAFSVLSDFRLNFTTVAHAVGAVSVAVVTPAGTTTVTGALTYV